MCWAMTQSCLSGKYRYSGSMTFLWSFTRSDFILSQYPLPVYTKSAGICWEYIETLQGTHGCNSFFKKIFPEFHLHFPKIAWACACESFFLLPSTVAVLSIYKHKAYLSFRVVLCHKFKNCWGTKHTHNLQYWCQQLHLS